VLQLDGESFCTGKSVYVDQPAAGGEPTAKVYVKVRPAGLEAVVLAQLDTGAAYSILDPEVAEGAGVATQAGEAITISTRIGLVGGRLVRHTITLIADEGDSLDLDATFFVPTDGWPIGRSFLGYSGFLDHIRTALDPQVNHFYFGPYVAA
jgi:hypothetical protein